MSKTSATSTSRKSAAGKSSSNYLSTALANSAIGPYPPLGSTARVTQYFSEYGQWQRELRQRLSDVNVPERMHLTIGNPWIEFDWEGQRRKLAYSCANVEMVVGLVHLAIDSLRTPGAQREALRMRRFQEISQRIDDLADNP